MRIQIYYGDVPKHFRKTGIIKKTVLAALGKLAKKPSELDLVFVTPSEMRALNKKFLRHDYVTDVITFPYDEGPVFGDIFVCYQIAKENARVYKHGAFKEMLTYAAHGALHLSGMDDKTKKQRAEMDARAEEIITKIYS